MEDTAVEAHEVTDLVTQLQQLASRFDADAIPADDVAGLLADLGQAKRLVDGMLTLAAWRTFDTTAPTPSGARAAREQVAKATGTTTRNAKKILDSSVALRDIEPLADAVRDGTLSSDQTAAIADAAAADESATLDLLDAARKQSVEDLRKTCRDTKTAADPDPAATRRRHHANRAFRSWHESDGEYKAFISAPADIGARIEAAIRGQHDAIFKAAHAEGRREADQAYRLDALLATLEQRTPGSASAGTRGGRQTKVIINVDASAMRRGYATAEETCDIAGVGRVSVQAVKEAIPSAHVAYVIRDAVDTSVVHLGRQVSAHQRTAMEARGYECEVPGCRSSHLLEIDHVKEWAFSRQTRLDQLAWLCTQHHRQTAGAYRLSGPPGYRRWHHRSVPPDLHSVAGRSYTLAPSPLATADMRASQRRCRILSRGGWRI